MKKIVLLAICLGVGSQTWAKLTSEDSVSVNISGGNSNSKTYVLKSDNKYTLKKSIFGLKGSYNYGESDDVRSDESWDIGIRYEYMLRPRLGVFIGELVEADRFSSIKRRYNTDLGFGYTYLKTKRTTVLSEGGFRYTVEESTDSSIDKKNDSKGRFYGEITRLFRKDLTGKFWVEFLPNFTVSRDYFINVEASLTILLLKLTCSIEKNCDSRLKKIVNRKKCFLGKSVFT